MIKHHDRRVVHHVGEPPMAGRDEDAAVGRVVLRRTGDVVPGEDARPRVQVIRYEEVTGIVGVALSVVGQGEGTEARSCPCWQTRTFRVRL
jgi:hypothetical protein